MSLETEVAPIFDAAIILGAMVLPDGRPSAALARRVRHGAGLFHRGRARLLVMSGGPVAHPVPEAEVMRSLALAAGVPDQAVLVEDCSQDTIGNARACLPLIAGHGWRRVVIVTDCYHLPRALYVFRRFGVAAAGSAARPEPPAGREWYLAWAREALALPWTVARLEFGRRHR